MGEPATPSPSDRRSTQLLAARIVEAVTNDERHPLAPGDHGELCDLPNDELEAAVFRLAQEITLLLDERHAQADALVASVANVESAMDDARELLELLANKLHAQQREAEKAP